MTLSKGVGVDSFCRCAREICIIKPELMENHSQEQNNRRFQVGGPSGLQVHTWEWTLSPGAQESMPIWRYQGLTVNIKVLQTELSLKPKFTRVQICAVFQLGQELLTRGFYRKLFLTNCSVLESIHHHWCSSLSKG